MGNNCKDRGKVGKDGRTCYNEENGREGGSRSCNPGYCSDCLNPSDYVYEQTRCQLDDRVYSVPDYSLSESTANELNLSVCHVLDCSPCIVNVINVKVETVCLIITARVNFLHSLSTNRPHQRLTKF